MFYAMLMLYAIYLLATDTGRFLKIALVLLALAWLIARLRGVRFSRKPSFIERWREESRRMAEAEAADEDPDEEDQEIPEDLFCDDDCDPAFCGLDREKEIVRLEKVLQGMYNRRDRMLYTYGCIDRGASAEDRERLERTKAWRGLDFDIRYTERRLEMLKGE